MNKNHIKYLGELSIKLIPEIISKENPKNILLVKGQKSFNLIEPLLSGLIDSDCSTFTVKESNISLEHSLSGLQTYLNHKCDLIIAIGGGSVIDMSKLISIFASQKKTAKYYLENMSEIVPKRNKLIAVPTTSGSGSESTHFAVVYDGIKKYSIAHKSLLPDYAIIDPQLTYSLSPHQTAVSGIDALCQSIESFWSVSSTKLSRDKSLKSIKLVINSLVTSVQSPTSFSRYDMCKASNLSGQAINYTKTTAPHAFAYPITKLLNIPHGHAVALTMPYFFELHAKSQVDILRDPRGIYFFKERMVELMDAMNISSFSEIKPFFSKFMNSIGLETKNPNRESDSNLLDIIYKNINLERLENNPIKVDERIAKDILNEVL